MSVLGHPETNIPKDETQQDSTHRPQTCLIGICKDVMSKMDPMRALGLQDEVVGTSLVTHKFSSSIFYWKELHKLQEGESKNTKCKPWLQKDGASGKASYPPFIAVWTSLEDNPLRYSYSDHECNNADSLHNESSRG